MLRYHLARPQVCISKSLLLISVRFKEKGEKGQCYFSFSNYEGYRCALAFRATDSGEKRERERECMKSLECSHYGAIYISKHTHSYRAAATSLSVRSPLLVRKEMSGEGTPKSKNTFDSVWSG